MATSYLYLAAWIVRRAFRGGRVLRWLTIILSFVIAGFVVRDVLHSYDVMQEMNRYRTVNADVGWGLWIMIVAAAIGMIGAVRLSEDEKIG